MPSSHLSTVLSLLCLLQCVLCTQYTPHGFGCQIPATANRLFCDPTAPLAARQADFLVGLSLQDKIALTGAAGGDPCSVVDGGVPSYGLVNVSQLIEATGAVSSDCFYDAAGTGYCPTVFPAPLALAASFNRSLMRYKGAVTGQEARAFNNLHVKRVYGNAVDLLAFGPDLNLIVDPRNGRNGENPSEDGYLSGEYALEYIKGAQEGEDPAHLMLALAVKHFALYQEETNRFGSNQNVSTFDLLDSYLVPYARAFTAGGAMGSMCAYNSINSRPSCAHSWLLTDMVRQYWGRPDAYTLSDCGAIEDQVTAHHTAANVSDASAQSMRAGCDGCAGTGYIMDGGLAGAVAQGSLTEVDIDAALTRLLTQRFKLGMFDPPASSPYTAYGPERIGTPDARAAAELAAAQGAVLLRNEGGLLPLSAASPALTSLAIVGPHAVSQRDLLGDFYSDAFCAGINNRSTRAAGCVPSFASAALAYLGAAGRGDVAVSVARGVDITGSDASGIPAALAAVAAADVTLLALGYSNAAVEREGADHAYTGLPGLQPSLLAQVLAAAAGRPVVLLLVNAGQVALDSLPQLPGAVVECFYPAFGAPAIVRQLFGGSNLWGRLPYTLYEAAFANSTALGDASISGAPGNATRTHRYYKGKPTHVSAGGAFCVHATPHFTHPHSSPPPSSLPGLWRWAELCHLYPGLHCHARGRPLPHPALLQHLFPVPGLHLCPGACLPSSSRGAHPASVPQRGR